jgi:YVTN family beta-propeller protein
MLLRKLLAALLLCAASTAQTFIPTGKTVTPAAAPGAVFEALNPQIAALPDLEVGYAVATAISPDGKTLLVLTSGYNRFTGNDGRSLSNEYVFVYDISQKQPVRTQVLQVSAAFNGIVWNPNGAEFYVSGGSNDTAIVFARQVSGAWAQASAIRLGHASGLGSGNVPLVAGLAVNASGNRLVTANFENDSVTVVDLPARRVLLEIDLRPVLAGILDPPGGEYPFWVVIQGDSIAYVSSIRDREIVTVDINRGAVVTRIPVTGQPNKMTLNKAQTLLYAALDNSDSIAVIDTFSHSVVEVFETIAPQSVYAGTNRLRGANPNSVALSPDEKTIYVTNGGSNSIAVVQLRQDSAGQSQVIGLIPTGWYPNSVSVSRDGSTLYAVNGKSNAGSNPKGPGTTANQYVLQLTRAGLLSLPVPDAAGMVNLTAQVAANNNFPGQADFTTAQGVMAALREKVNHVIYIVKENRTYDQILGDLEIGNGDPRLAMFPEPVTPNLHRLARQFVTLDNFYDTAEVSGNGWNWSTAGRATDVVEKTVPVNYAGRGGTYDWEGTNRNTIPGSSLNNPRFLPGTADVSAPDGPNGEAGAGYLWDGALRAGLAIRNYGFFVANIPGASISAQPHADGIQQVLPANPVLANATDLYYRGFDQSNADYYLFREWEREFDGYVARGDLPHLTLIRLPHDHTGNFGTALWGVNTPETQVADNDYAVGLFVQKVVASPYSANTLIFIVEDDAQNGADHVDGHRSIAFVIGPYVKQKAVVSKIFTTVSMVRTIKEVLGIDSMNFFDGLTEPMADVFDLEQSAWSYQAIVPEILRTTKLPVPSRTVANSLPRTKAAAPYSKPRHKASYWEKRLGDQDFEQEDRLETDRYNQVLWEGLMGKRPYPKSLQR